MEAAQQQGWQVLPNPEEAGALGEVHEEVREELAQWEKNLLKLTKSILKKIKQDRLWKLLGDLNLERAQRRSSFELEETLKGLRAARGPALPMGTWSEEISRKMPDEEILDDLSSMGLKELRQIVKKEHLPVKTNIGGHWSRKLPEFREDIRLARSAQWRC